MRYVINIGLFFSNFLKNSNLSQSSPSGITQKQKPLSQKEVFAHTFTTSFNTTVKI